MGALSSSQRVGVLGATSHVGDCLLEILRGAGWEVVAFSRHDVAKRVESVGGWVQWRSLRSLASYRSEVPSGIGSGPSTSGSGEGRIECWISLIPIVALPAYFPMLGAYGARRVVALSSTSRFTKEGSSDANERVWAQELAEAEDQLAAWAKANEVEWIVLRPTLIYGMGRDRNISVIAGFIRRFGFFPLFGQAEGLRQPIHARDVARACHDTVTGSVSNRAYTISGAETLTYREMVARVFQALRRPVRFVVVPIVVFRGAIAVLKVVPRFRYLSVAMVERMNRDLAFDHEEAARDFGFSPLPFRLDPVDLPK